MQDISEELPNEADGMNCKVLGYFLANIMFHLLFEHFSWR